MGRNNASKLCNEKVPIWSLLALMPSRPAPPSRPFTGTVWVVLLVSLGCFGVTFAVMYYVYRAVAPHLTGKEECNTVNLKS